MRRKILTASASLLLIGSLTAIGLVIHEYSRDKEAFQLLYTRVVKKRDIVDASRNAMAALSDAEVREQDYVLTGETVYSQAYADDINSWRDESATLALVAANDPAKPIAQDFSKAGNRTLDELAVVVSLFEENGRDAALERIRKSSSAVYLDQARNSLARMKDLDEGRFDGTYDLSIRSLSAMRHLTAGAVALFLAAAAGIFLLIFELRRDSRKTRELALPLRSMQATRE